MTELNTSELGTQEYWNKRYQLEIDNFRDHGELGDVWFGEESVNRVCKWIYRQDDIKPDSKILDVGCGNGILLLELAKEDYTDLHGVDYSEEAIILAKEIIEKENLNIKYDVFDILNDTLDTTYDVIHDKGTYDAISLSEEAKKNREICISKVHEWLATNGYYIITSCNWTKTELEEHFSEKFTLLNAIPTPQFRFGGQVGNSVTALVFKKR